MGFDGTWDTIAETPMGTQTFVLELQSDGTRLSGAGTGPMGSMQVNDGEVRGDEAFWTMNAKTLPMKLKVSVTRDGDALSGTIKAGFVGTFRVTGTRRA